MNLPILLSVPHAGLRVPAEAEPYCRLSAEEIRADSDEGAAQIYSLDDHVTQLVTTDVARAIVDLNRAEDDFRPDGVIKTHTCWNAPVYHAFPPDDVVGELLRRYYDPYHDALAAPPGDVRLGIDCHTMAATGPPIGPDPGAARPGVCLGDAHGKTLPETWMNLLAASFAKAFGCQIAINRPFSGGYITRHHGAKRPWLQLELSRAPFMTNADKRASLLTALTDFCRQVG